MFKGKHTMSVFTKKALRGRDSNRGQGALLLWCCCRARALSVQIACRPGRTAFVVDKHCFGDSTDSIGTPLSSWSVLTPAFDLSSVAVITVSRSRALGKTATWGQRSADTRAMQTCIQCATSKG